MIIADDNGNAGHLKKADNRISFIDWVLRCDGTLCNLTLLSTDADIIQNKDKERQRKNDNNIIEHS